MFLSLRREQPEWVPDCLPRHLLQRPIPSVNPLLTCRVLALTSHPHLSLPPPPLPSCSSFPAFFICYFASHLVLHVSRHITFLIMVLISNQSSQISFHFHPSIHHFPLFPSLPVSSHIFPNAVTLPFPHTSAFLPHQLSVILYHLHGLTLSLLNTQRGISLITSLHLSHSLTLSHPNTAPSAWSASPHTQHYNWSSIEESAIISSLKISFSHKTCCTHSISTSFSVYSDSLLFLSDTGV